MNVAGQSEETSFYNNYSFGLWGSCCTTTTLTWTEVSHPANIYVFNNLAIQSCADGETAQAVQLGPTNGIIANNTFIGCSTVPSNTEALQIYGTNVNYENNAIENYGQYVVVNSGSTFTAFDNNIYGPIGLSGNSNWQCGSTGTNSFPTWQSACAGDAHGQHVTSLLVSSSGAPISGSPLIGAGANLYSICNMQPNPGLGALCFDRNGAARPHTGAWDAGAYAFGTSGAPQSPSGLSSSVH
jgi:hypothetical protein